nr:core protein C [Hepacivirus vittatae]
MPVASSNRNTKKRARPLGRVVGGVYVVNTKKSSEAGRPNRRPQRDARKRKGNWGHAYKPIPGVDPLSRVVGRTVFPSDHWAPGDPRWRSRNLGHLIDTPLGWVADIGGAIPLVGPVVGPVCRGVCKAVRAAEDGINWGSSWVGLTFFIIMLLGFCTTPAES